MAVSPIARKLLIKPGMRLLVLAPPEEYLDQLQPLPEGTSLVEGADSTVDFAQVFARDAAQAQQLVPRAVGALKPGGLLWVCYLKGGKKAGTDLNRDIL